jgi:hypothetical protein
MMVVMLMKSETQAKMTVVTPMKGGQLRTRLVHVIDEAAGDAGRQYDEISANKHGRQREGQPPVI